MTISILRLSVPLLCWSLIDQVSSQTYLLTPEVLEYMNIVTQLQEVASGRDLTDQMMDNLAQQLNFNTISYQWETTSTMVDDEFAQVIMGRRDSVCYAVFHASSIDPDFQFALNPLPLPNTKVQRENCDDDCSCRVHWEWIEINFPQKYQSVLETLKSCMSVCLDLLIDGDGKDCQMVLGGHGGGGSVATLISLLIAPIYRPFVIASGSCHVLYDNRCTGINEDRYFRFINTDTPADSNAPFGICFDDVPFVGAAEWQGIGHTIGLGLEKDGMAIATEGMGQLVILEDGTTRNSLCRSAHDLLAYNLKMQTASFRTPLGVTPDGFSNYQYCEVDEDCRTGSSCEPSNDYPICKDATTEEPATATEEPTDGPTVAPTFSPTTRAPILSPTLNPTSPGPTARPTRGPTVPPTANPTTDWPTESPTQTLTQPPTQNPTIRTAYPVHTTDPPRLVSPSEIPTYLPTEMPSGEATSPKESEKPTEDAANTQPPTELVKDNDAPTPQPVASPPPTLLVSDLPLFDAFFRATITFFDVADELAGFSVFVWEDETSDHLQGWIEQHTKTYDWDPPIVDLRVQSNIVSQLVLFTTVRAAESKELDEPTIASSIMEAREVPEETKDGKDTRLLTVGSRSRTPSRGRRRVQTETTNRVAESLEIVFEIAIAYRTQNEKHLDLSGLILEAFQTREARENYSMRLKESDDTSFQTMTDFILQIQDNPDAVNAASGGNEGEDETIIWALVGVAAGLLVVSSGLFLLYCKKRVNNDIQKSDDSTSSGKILEHAIFEPASAYTNRISPDGTPVSRLSQEIVIDDQHDDGISTLGDPTFYPGVPPNLQDEQTASVSYAQNYLKMHEKYDDHNRTFRSNSRSTMRSLSAGSGLSLSKVGSGLSNLNEISAIFSDDDSFEEQFAGEDKCFTVLAPPGKLGIIIDLSPSGEPMVRAVSPDSVLAHKVKIGDRLLSVDGEGCAEMSAEHVSKLIAMKSNKSCREIMFVRRPADIM